MPINTPQVPLGGVIPSELLHEEIAAVVAFMRMRGLSSPHSYQVALMTAVNLIRTELAPHMTLPEAAMETSLRMADFHAYLCKRN